MIAYLWAVTHRLARSYRMHFAALRHRAVREPHVSRPQPLKVAGSLCCWRSTSGGKHRWTTERSLVGTAGSRSVPLGPYHASSPPRRPPVPLACLRSGIAEPGSPVRGQAPARLLMAAPLCPCRRVPTCMHRSSKWTTASSDRSRGTVAGGKYAFKPPGTHSTFSSSHTRPGTIAAPSCRHLLPKRYRYVYSPVNLAPCPSSTVL